MSFQEKRSIVSIIGTLAISAGYLFYMAQRAQQGGAGTSEDPRFWAGVILILIPVFVVFKVIFHVVFVVINVVATREEEPGITDEFDKMVELKSTRNFYHVFMAGFLLSLAALVIEQPLPTMFLVVIGTIVVAAVVQDISQLYYYRRGV
jgi:uncharacterized membrane protein